MFHVGTFCDFSTMHDQSNTSYAFMSDVYYVVNTSYAFMSDVNDVADSLEVALHTDCSYNALHQHKLQVEMSPLMTGTDDKPTICSFTHNP